MKAKAQERPDPSPFGASRGLALAGQQKCPPTDGGNREGDPLGSPSLFFGAPESCGRSTVVLMATPDEVRHEEYEVKEGHSLVRDLSRAMVALYKEYVGRGPTQARAYVEEDLITIVLQDTMTTAEKTLAEEEEKDLVRGVRRVLQGKFREDAVEIVERLTGRDVKAFLSDHAIDPDIAVEVFVLDPGEDV
jgi:uncharacterized protein YbcI